MSYILVVDDEPTVQDIIKLMLRKVDLPVESALNGEIALQKATERPPRIILLDVMMPIMDGATTLRKLQSNERTRDIPVLIISALPRSAIALPALESVDANVRFLEKRDFRPSTMVEIVRQMIADTQPTQILVNHAGEAYT